LARVDPERGALRTRYGRLPGRSRILSAPGPV